MNQTKQNSVSMSDIGIENNITSDLHITAFETCHGDIPSSAFLLSYEPKGNVESQVRIITILINIY